MSCMITNNGTINLNKPITADAIEAFRKELRENNLDEQNYSEIILGMVTGETAIEIEDSYDRELETTCKHLVNALSPLGYEFNARIEYYGDYDGRIYIDKNVVSEFDIADCWKHDVEDKVLIEILEKRNYDMSAVRKDMERRARVRKAIDDALTAN